MFYTSSLFRLSIYFYNGKMICHSALTFCCYNETLEIKLVKGTVLSCLTISGINQSFCFGPLGKQNTLRGACEGVKKKNKSEDGATAP